MNRGSAKAVSALLVRWQSGDQQALHALMPPVYDELRRVAHQYLQAERKDHTLRSTELVHEAYPRLVDQQSSENRAHFFAVAARLMREILVDCACSRRALKRGYGCKIRLDQALESAQKQDLDVLALDDVLNDPAGFDSQPARIVELRFFPRTLD